jgi:hypothetical protein
MANKKEAVTEQPEQLEQTQASDTTEGMAPESISLNDLQVLANIVDLASQRGAFRGNEMTQVGAVFDKLTSFLQQVAAAQAATEDSESESTAEAPVEEAQEA